MNKLVDNILKDYKKSNKQRRQRLLKNYGFSTEAEFFASINEEPELADPNVLDIVIAFDTTGSMASYRNEVKRVASRFVDELFGNIPNLNMEIISFGDYCDGKNMFQRSGLTGNSDKLVKFIDDCKDTEGGDNDEFYEYVIQQVVRNTSWRKGSNRVFVLLGDANPHQVGYKLNGETYNISWQDEVENAVSEGVNIHTIYVPTTSGNNISFYKTVANKTGGAFLEFKHIDRLPAVLQGIAYSKGNMEEFENVMEKALVENDTVLTGYYKTILETI